MADIAKRMTENPILRPADIRPSIPGMTVESLLNLGVFRFHDKTWLLLRVAERPQQKPGTTSFPIIGATGELQILEFDNSDPQLNLSDPRVINYAGKDYLTTMSHLRMVASDDGIITVPTAITATASAPCCWIWNLLGRFWRAQASPSWNLLLNTNASVSSAMSSSPMATLSTATP